MVAAVHPRPYLCISVCCMVHRVTQAAESCRRRPHLPHLLVEAQAQPLLLRPVELQVRHQLLQLLLVAQELLLQPLQL
ncbi:hypothetical protein WJX77_009948 [Trebouxia sp. C0004]